jgi:tetratricopeptide (TPR) repeat protein
MRLLHFNEAGRLVLMNFPDDGIPPYAILSHRWGGPGSEVLFQDLGRDRCKEKDGYRKIDFCAKRLAEDQLQYFWVDTCCIDKWNLRELSHSINSMFQWYQNAAKCYVFLSDVSVSTANEVRQQSSWEQSFRASEWFTRGWTLQELIAPQQVEFFSREGQQIGDKSSLEELLHEITAIPRSVLQNCPIDKFSITERKTWAANRRTTEEEDIVYCLLGILDVSMPVNYGEGKEVALRRLQMIEEEAAGSVPSVLPFPRNDQYVGWEPQLVELEAKLFSAKQTNALVIVGPHGTGKSELALEFAHRTRQKHKNCSVFWIDASDMDSLFQSYASVAQKLEIPEWDDENVDFKVKLRLEEQSTRRSLMIFDNIQDLSSGSEDATATHFMDYLPRSEHCSIVFTTASRDTVKKLALQHVVRPHGLTARAAQRMLENYLGNVISESDKHEAKLLLNELSYFPLAIVQAASYITATGATLQEYRAKLNRLSDTASEYSRELPKWEDPVAATLLMSIEQIRGSSALALEYLCLAACVFPKDIPLDFFPAPSSRDRDEALKLLSRYKLITRRPAESAIDVDLLTHYGLREWLEKQGLRSLWNQNAITRLCCVFPTRRHNKRSKWKRLLPHTGYVLANSPAKRVIDDRLTLTMKCALALHNDGWYNQAEELFVQVKETRERVLGKEHPDTLLSMANLASTIADQGRWTDAEALLKSVLEVQERVLGEEHRSTLSSMNSLASTIAEQGRWEEAEELFVQVTETRKRALGENDLQTLDSMSNLAWIYRKQELWKKAEDIESRVITIKNDLLGVEHPDTLRNMSNLASGYSGQKQWDMAEVLMVQVLEERKRVLGKEHPDTLISMFNLANVLREQGRDDESLSLVNAHFLLARQILGDEHPHTKLSLQKGLEWEGIKQ